MSRVDTDYYDEVLSGIGAPITTNNLRYLAAWQAAEGGNATNNAFNTTQPEDGATNYNSVGVKNYVSKAQGIAATIRTLLNPHYPNIVKDLRASDDPKVTASEDAEISTWGTDPAVIRARLGDTAAPTQTDGSVKVTTGPAQGTENGNLDAKTDPNSNAPADDPLATTDNSLVGGGLEGAALKIGIYLIAGLAGGALVVGGLWKTVSPTVSKVADNAAKAGQAAAVVA